MSGGGHALQRPGCQGPLCRQDHALCRGPLALAKQNQTEMIREQNGGLVLLESLILVLRERRGPSPLPATASPGANMPFSGRNRPYFLAGPLLFEGTGQVLPGNPGGWQRFAGRAGALWRAERKLVFRQTCPKNNFRPSAREGWRRRRWPIRSAMTVKADPRSEPGMTKGRAGEDYFCGIVSFWPARMASDFRPLAFLMSSTLTPLYLLAILESESPDLTV